VKNGTRPLNLRQIAHRILHVSRRDIELKGGFREDIVFINSDFGISYLIVAFALLGIIFTDSLLTALRIERWHPKLRSAALGTLLGLALIEAVTVFV
jgi:hypothetical protein